MNLIIRYCLDTDFNKLSTDTIERLKEIKDCKVYIAPDEDTISEYDGDIMIIVAPQKGIDYLEARKRRSIQGKISLDSILH